MLATICPRLPSTKFQTQRINILLLDITDVLLLEIKQQFADIIIQQFVKNSHCQVVTTYNLSLFAK